MTINTAQVELEGKTITLEHGKVANQANGAVLVKCGETIVLATACMSPEPREGMNFFPLTCDYEERKYAVGKIPGGFVKRGGRPSEKAILTSRLIDRPLRPLFPEGMRNDVQIIAIPLSMEPDHPADVLAVLASSAALAVSDIPWNGPLGCVRVCRIDGQLVVNPSLEQIREADFELVVAGAGGNVMEIEFEGDQIDEHDLLAAIDFACEANDRLVALQMELVEKVGKPKVQVPLVIPDVEFVEEISGKVSAEIEEALRLAGTDAREGAIFELKDKLALRLAEEYPERVAELDEVLEKLFKKQVRHMILDEGTRPDGRQLDEIRPISCEVGLLPRVHGSGLFSRGQTQVLTTLTLGSLDDAQIIDTLEEDGEKRFMHFYNYPPFSNGEVKPLRAAGRREIGHGALAEKALRRMVPEQEDFPYTLLLTSEVLESKGSTSMASTCGCTLALMDAGVQIKAPVAGISIGLVSDPGQNRNVLLTDIHAWEDFYGDMDFKVAGSRNGVTAIQVDTKIAGLSRDVVAQALEKARTARLEILDIMARTIDKPRESLSQYAPRVFVIEIHPDKIGDVIGPGGKVIKKIEAETGARLDIEQDGHVYITSVDAAGGERARKIVEDLTREVQVGEVYTGRVTRIENFGAFVEILPGRDGLVHISQLARERVNRTEDVCHIGDELLVRVIEVGEDGKIRLTRRGLIEGDEGYEPGPAETRRDVIDRSRASGGSGGRPQSHGGGDRDKGRLKDKRQGPDDDFGPRARFRPKR